MVGTGAYLLAIFIAGGLALYYESFLYAQMIVPVLLLLLLRGLPSGRSGVVMMWAMASVWGLSSGQQILTYRVALGL